MKTVCYVVSCSHRYKKKGLETLPHLRRGFVDSPRGIRSISAHIDHLYVFVWIFDHLCFLDDLFQKQPFGAVRRNRCC